MKRFFIRKLPFGGDLLDALDLAHAEPTSIGGGAALGVFGALAPPTCGLTWLVLFAAGCTSANFTAALLAALVLKPFAVFLLDPLAWEVGKKIDESGAAPLIAKLTSVPGVALLGLERYHVMGSLVFGFLAAIPVFILARVLAGLLQKGGRKAIDAAKDKLRRGEKLSDEERDLAQLTPRRLPFRLKLVVLLGVVLVVFDFVGMKPAMSWVLQRKLPIAVGAALGVPPTKVEWKSLEASLLRGVVSFDELRIADPQKPTEDLFRAKKVTARLSPVDLLADRIVIEELRLEEPRLHVRRTEDGRLTLDPAKQDPAAKPAPESGWVQAVRAVLEAAKVRADQEARERAGKVADGKPADGKSDGKEVKLPDGKLPDVKTIDVRTASDVRPAVQPPTTPMERLKRGIPGFNPSLENHPRVVIRKVICAGLEVETTEPQGATPGFRFDDGELRELTDDRVANGRPSRVTLKGTILDATRKPSGKISFDLTIDPPGAGGEEPKLKLDLAVQELDLAGCDTWLAGFCPLRFPKGKAKVSLALEAQGLAGPIVAAPKLELVGIEAQPREPGKTILGFDGQKVAHEVTEAGAFALTDVKVTGTLLDPKVDMGDTLKNLVIEGGKRYAAKAAAQVVDKAAAEAAKKAQEKLGDKAGEATKGLLDKGKGLFGK